MTDTMTDGGPARGARVYLVYASLLALAYALASTLQLVYQVTIVGLDPFQLVVVGTVLEATVFLFEIPTGVLADTYSRKASIVVGVALSGTGFLLQGLIPTFWAAVACSVVWGVGFTFASGAAEAWLVDEVGPASAQPVLTRARQLGLAVTVAGIVLAGVIGLGGLGLPLVAAGVVFLALAVLLVFAMPETSFAPAPRGNRETFRGLLRQARVGVRVTRANRVAGSIVLVSLFVGLSSEAVDRLWTDRILSDFTLPSFPGLGGRDLGPHDAETIAFTVFALVGTMISLVVSLTVNRVTPRTVNHVHPRLLMAFLTSLQVVGIVVLAVSPYLGLAMAGLWLRQASGDVAYPVQMAWLNRNVPSGSRATVMSLSSQVDAVGQVVGGPSIAAVGSRLGLTVALLTSAVVLSPAVVVYLLVRKLRGGSTAVAVPVAAAER